MARLLSTVCPTCLVQPNEHCRAEDGVQEVGVHASRRRLVDGLIATPEDFAGALTAKFAGEPEHSNKTFGVSPGGQKYIRITQGRTDAESVHCFVERSTGYVFKASGWKTPAKGIRYISMLAAFEAADIYGGYLYKR